MRRYKYYAILLIILIMISQGCSQQAANANAKQWENQQSTVSKDDLSMVNEYLKEIGSKEIPLDAAEDMNDSINENSQTQEKKSDWQLLVDYIINERSAQPTALTYSIEFDEGAFTVQMDKIWENITR